MRKKTVSFYYVIVMRGEDCPRFVTECLTEPKKVVKYEANKKPYKFMSIEDAQYVCLGLMWRGMNAYPVAMNFELEQQPYEEEGGEE